MASFIWTEQVIAQTRQLYAEGHPFSHIAARIGCPSRNAVIGKVHRLGLDRRGRPKAETKVAKLPAPKAEKRTLPPRNIAGKTTSDRREHFQAVADKALDKFDATVVASAQPVRFLDRGLFQCAMPQPGWESAPVAEKMVCGQPVQAGTSWCPACLKIVASPPTLASFKHRRMVRGIAA